MELILGIATGLVILVILVVLHELGHAIVARRNGVVVEEFGIGFPPRAWKKKLKNGILFSLNWLPLGGFVKLQGEHDAADKKGDYGAATFWQKTKILLAGVLINWVTAAVLLTILALTGMPKILPNQFSVPGDTTIVHNPVEIVTLSKDYPAEDAGLQVGDTIIRFAGQEVPTVDKFIDLTKQYNGQKVDVIYSRDGVEHSADMNLDSDAEDIVIGAGLGQRELTQSTWSAPIVGVVSTAQFTWATLQGIGDLLANLTQGIVMQFSTDANTRNEAAKDLKAVGDSVAGPVGILGTIFPTASAAGPTQLVFLTAIISLTLAVMNVLPIPALDGGRWFTMALFKLFRKKLTKKREENIQTVGFLMLVGLIILVTFADVSKLF